MKDHAVLPENLSVETFLNNINDKSRKNDSKELIALMQSATGAPPKMWGSSIIGFGTHHYKYDTGREGDTVAVGFSPRKAALVLYGVVYYDQNLEEVKKLGKFKLGKGCLYIKSLSDVNTQLLADMVAKAYALRNNA
jgi:uncharacterized protein DUF1801